MLCIGLLFGLIAMTISEQASHTREFKEGLASASAGLIKFSVSGFIAYLGYRIGVGGEGYDRLIQIIDPDLTSEYVPRDDAVKWAMFNSAISFCLFLDGVTDVAQGSKRIKHSLKVERAKAAAKSKPNGLLRRPPERLDYDVLTGLPNHRATSERRMEIMAQLAARQGDQPGKANNAPWTHTTPGCFDRAEELAGDVVKVGSFIHPVVNPRVSSELSQGIVELVMDGSYMKLLDELGLDDDSIDREYREGL
jgi:hypothetical protein